MNCELSKAKILFINLCLINRRKDLGGGSYFGSHFELISGTSKPILAKKCESAV